MSKEPIYQAPPVAINLPPALEKALADPLNGPWTNGEKRYVRLVAEALYLDLAKRFPEKFEDLKLKGVVE